MKTNAGRLISADGFNNKIQIGCNIHQLPQLVNVKFSVKTRPGRRLPIEWRLISASHRGIMESGSFTAAGSIVCRSLPPYHLGRIARNEPTLKSIKRLELLERLERLEE